MPTSQRIILIVDDDDLFRGGIADALTNANYHVLEASDGREAMRIIESRSDIDVILSDIRMPILDGSALLHWVHDHYPQIPIIMLTAEGTIQSAVEMMRSGALNYLTKPFRIQPLLESVEEAILLRDQWHDADEENVNKPHSGSAHNNNSVSVRRVGELTIDGNRMIVEREAQRIQLTPTEFTIFDTLIYAEGKVVNYEDMVKIVRDQRVSRDTARQMLSSHLSNLRNKLQLINAEDYLINSRGRGYFVDVSGA